MFNTSGRRSEFRKQAWLLACSDIFQLVSTILTACSSSLALARSLSSNVDRNNWLYGFELATLVLSYGAQLITNINTIDKLTDLHHKNKAMHPSGYINTNGITLGISGPTIAGLTAGMVGTIGSATTFFKSYSVLSAIIGVVTPIVSNTISTFAKSRLEIEETALKKHLAVEAAERQAAAAVAFRVFP